MTLTNPLQRTQRIVSIDVLRGLTVAFMILVNNNGSGTLSYRLLNHAPWNGFTPTDLVFPTFMFIMGISLVLSLSAKLERGATTSAILPAALRRFVLLLVFGLIVNGFPFFHLATLRIYGVLQRFAVCYILVVLLMLATRKVAIWGGIIVALLIGYWILLRHVSIPGHGLPGVDFPFMDRDLNLTAYIDRHVFPGRLYEGTRDPEGLLSDLPSLATVLLGMITGAWLRTTRSVESKAAGILAAGITFVLAGYAWSFTFPLNKKLWTSSFVLFAAGWSLLLLAVFYYLIEVRKDTGRWTMPALVFGMNAIASYVLSELLASVLSVVLVRPHYSVQNWLYDTLFRPIVNPAFGSLIYSLAFVLVCWLPMLILYRRKIFLKL
jgi:predicted acyltransferase